jgi:hypothetical protein
VTTGLSTWARRVLSEMALTACSYYYNSNTIKPGGNPEKRSSQQNLLLVALQTTWCSSGSKFCCKLHKILLAKNWRNRKPQSRKEVISISTYLPIINNANKIDIRHPLCLTCTKKRPFLSTKATKT